MTDMPLKGLRIVVTRPRAQVFSLAQGIEAAGGIPLIFSLLEIAATEINQDFSERLHAVPDANFVIFISPNAVRFGLEVLRRAGVTFSPLTQIAAVGQGTARALHEAGCRVALVPETQFDSEGLLALPALQQIEGQRVVIVRGEGGRELLAGVLRSRGARVDYLECYARHPAVFDGGALLAEHPDVLTVTSSEALDVLWDGLDDAARAAILDVPLLVIHPRIAARAQQHGWRNVQITAAGDDGLLAGLIAWAARES